MTKLFYILFFTLLFFPGNTVFAQKQKPVVYLIPGQGADCRLFKNLEIDTTFETQYIHYFTPREELNLKGFAHALSRQIDTSRTYIIIGVSLGGMLATEMGDFLNPEKIILISSAKTRKEFPFRYRIQKRVHVYEWFPGSLVKKGALIMQPIIEPDRNKDKDVFIRMLKDKDPLFLERTVAMILEWERLDYRKDIIHIHGDNDHTLPIKNVKYDYLIKGGSHMMVLTRGAEISKLVNQILLNSTEQ